MKAKRLDSLPFRSLSIVRRLITWRCFRKRGIYREAAANLFAAIRRLDAAKLDMILAEAVPEVGLGRAIMDRLRRASHKEEIDS